ncbi:uncharacterized protein METZ01_LOCUS93521 [marine metagenome]|uniref:Nucleotide modification associated domain-containing protein n=1 Tax=marine metagenome TaxID=408172 RepID=A0A381VLY7_9ZZZZ|tara:strand:- start:2224 stop:2397 length:174 start_codon:yes stop_codon:yes gene_type:complete
MQDKVSRLLNLLEKKSGRRGYKEAAIAKIKHESLEDTYKDAANYAMIGLLLKRGLWK